MDQLWPQVYFSDPSCPELLGGGKESARENTCKIAIINSIKRALIVQRALRIHGNSGCWCSLSDTLMGQKTPEEHDPGNRVLLLHSLGICYKRMFSGASRYFEQETRGIPEGQGGEIEL